MRLTGVRLESKEGFISLVGTIAWEGGGGTELFYRFPEEFSELVLASADPFLPALLPPCMMSGEPLALDPGVDALLLSRLDRVQDLLTGWNPGFARVQVQARDRTDAAGPPGAASASLFSGGVDSYYTLVKASRAGRPLPYVLFMAGLEQPLERSRGVGRAVALAEAGARRFGARLIQGETNLRSLFPTVNYERTYQSAALSSAALALSRGLRRLLIPSSVAYSQLEPWGSHPLLDELWSTRRLEVVHDGAEARRIEKLAFLASDPEVLAGLRVCLENASGPHNCGVCRKCVRTMVGLDLLGARGHARLFPEHHAPSLERRLAADHPELLNELLDFAQTRRVPPRLLRQIERATQMRNRARAFRELLRNTPVLAEAYGLAQKTRAWLSAVEETRTRPGPWSGGAPSALVGP